LKRVLITGGSGFVGANLARRVLRDGHDTHLLVRPSYSSWRLDEIAGDVRLHHAPIEDGPGVRALVREIRPDWVFNLAAFGAYSNQTGMDRMVATNLLGCVSLLDASIEAGVEAFVQTGSSSEYGLKDHAATEDEQLDPNSHYAITKAAATHYCRYSALQRNVNAITLRLYSIYGPYEEPSRLIPTLLIHGLHGQLPPLVSPLTARDFVYVEDAVAAMVQVAAAPAVRSGAVFNVSSGLQSSLKDVVAITRKLMGVTAEPQWATMEQRSWDTNVWSGSPTGIEREIAWSAATGLEKGLRQTIDWLQADRRRLQYYQDRVFAKP
jgi:UDP-glucose 4-epimerase